MGRVDEEHVTFTGLGGGQELASVRGQEKRLGLQRARPSNFWRHGDRTDPVKLQAQILEGTAAYLAGPAAGFTRVSSKMRSHASAMVVAGCFSERARLRTSR